MIVGSGSHDQVQNYQAKPSTQGEAATALVTAYTLTHNRQYLDVASQILQSVFGSSGLWDQQRGGLFFAFDMQKGQLLSGYKETRSQTLVLSSLLKYDKEMYYVRHLWLFEFRRGIPNNRRNITQDDICPAASWP
jgi:hypothetical protein